MYRNNAATAHSCRPAADSHESLMCSVNSHVLSGLCQVTCWVGGGQVRHVHGGGQVRHGGGQVRHVHFQLGCQLLSTPHHTTPHHTPEHTLLLGLA